ncbi:YitT family protein [Leuconostoc gelidum]|uniref:YitT family protein n=1 Tax=Leuconostoc gelidum TaxID=1244 RepID=UPI001C7CB354|nr:YitT family protein [Leuconostoc gelidum]MBZ6008346.1 YitT family protein [Leuconostoc gelidum subsp. aenigmaticum]MBZ6010793.1 YitT family protein [Leuconostoc gelidum subsp. aenigmaticum]
MDNTNLARISIKDIIMITIGTGFYGWSLININITNQLAEGGLSGITLILLALFNWNPAYTNLILNIPLLIIGYRVLGRRSLIYTIWGIISLSFWLYVWQKFPMPPALHHDMLIAGLLAGIMSGIGLGVVFRFGGTSGGTDVIARIMEQKLGIQIGRTMFALDAVVLLMSLIYIDVIHMMYTLIASFVFAQVVGLTQQGAYTARSFMIFTDYPEEISHAIMHELERGTSLLKSEGGYSHREQRVVYAVVDPSEVSTVQHIIQEIDPKAFVSIFTAQEQLGEGFSYLRPKKKFIFF